MTVDYIYSNENYELIVVDNPTNERIQSYGVKNLETEVIEAYVNSLAVAKHVADEFDADLREGLDRDSDDDTPDGSQVQPRFTWTD